MNIFQSGLPIQVIKGLHEIDPTRKPNVLLTFYGLENSKEYRQTHRSKIKGLILDCGTYSLYRKKLSIEAHNIECDKLFRQYKDYAKANQKEYDFLFSFDGKYTPDGFDHNYELLLELESAGINLVPVLHTLSDEEISFYVERKIRYPIGAIGQCEDENRDDLNILFDPVYKLYSKGIKVHLFGMTSVKIVSYVPAYSCDSRSWLEYGGRGRALYFNPEKRSLDKEEKIFFPSKQFPRNTGNSVHYNDFKQLDVFLAHIHSKLHLTRKDVLAEQTQSMSLALINALYFIELEERITEENRLRGITFE